MTDTDDPLSDFEPETAPPPPVTGQPFPLSPAQRAAEFVDRREKFSAEVVRAICDAVELGCHLSDAAAVAGIAGSTLHRWRKEKPELEPLLDAAAARGIAKRLRVISDADAADDDPKWAAWLLQHRHPDRWARANRGQVQVNVGERSNVQLVDQTVCDALNASWSAFEAALRDDTADADNNESQQLELSPETGETDRKETLE